MFPRRHFFFLRAFYLCTIIKVLYYFCTIENYKSSSAPSKKLFFPSIPFRPLSSLTVSTIQWDHVVSGQDSYLPPLAPPMAPPTPLCSRRTHQQQPRCHIFLPPPSSVAYPSALSCNPARGWPKGWIRPAAGLARGWGMLTGGGA